MSGYLSLVLALALIVVPGAYGLTRDLRRTGILTATAFFPPLAYVALWVPCLRLLQPAGKVALWCQRNPSNWFSRITAPARSTVIRVVVVGAPNAKEIPVLQTLVGAFAGHLERRPEGDIRWYTVSLDDELVSFKTKLVAKKAGTFGPSYEVRVGSGQGGWKLAVTPLTQAGMTAGAQATVLS